MRSYTNYLVCSLVINNSFISFSQTLSLLITSVILIFFFLPRTLNLQLSIRYSRIVYARLRFIFSYHLRDRILFGAIAFSESPALSQLSKTFRTSGSSPEGGRGCLTNSGSHGGAGYEKRVASALYPLAPLYLPPPRIAHPPIIS